MLTEARADRAEAAIKAYVHDDLTLKEIGKRYGVTREMIRLDCNRIDPTLYRLACRRRKARVRLATYVNKGRVIGLKKCKLCGNEFRGSTVFCSPAHRKIYISNFRYHTSDKSRLQHHVAMAKLILRNEDSLPSQKAYANNVLNDNVGEGRRAGTRFLVHGSLAFHWAIRAYVLEWPVFDQLPEQIQDQIREHVSR